MRYYPILILFLLLSIHSLLSASPQTETRYERRLKSFGIEEFNENKIISFILDNDWTFEGKINPLEINKLFSLENLLESRVRIVGNKISLQGLELIIECPVKEGIDKMSFLVAPTYETYTQLPTVTAVEILIYIFGSHGALSLSDGSSWNLANSLDITHARKYWAEGDRVLITKCFDHDQKKHLLVNVDISGEYFYSRSTRYQSFFCPQQDSFTIDDPRNLSVYLE